MTTSSVPIWSRARMAPATCLPATSAGRSARIAHGSPQTISANWMRCGRRSARLLGGSSPGGASTTLGRPRHRANDDPLDSRRMAKGPSVGVRPHVATHPPCVDRRACELETSPRRGHPAMYQTPLASRRASAAVLGQDRDEARMSPEPYYSDETVTIYHGDCRDILPALAPADLLIADPPYMNKLDETWDTQWGHDSRAFLAWLGEFLEQVRLTERGTLAVFASPEMAARVELAVRERFGVFNHIVWRKPVPGTLGQADKDGLRSFYPSSERIILAERHYGPEASLDVFTAHARHQTARHIYADLRERLVEMRDQAGFTNGQIDAILGTVGMAGHYFGGSQWSLPTEAQWAKLRAAGMERGGAAPGGAGVKKEFGAN